MPDRHSGSTTLPADPWDALDAWMAEAVASEPRVPDAMQLATVDIDGRPSLRTVLLKSHGPSGLVFYTNLGSRKGRQILDRPTVAALLHWKSLERQVIAEGPVEPVTPEEADAYWATRDRGSQLGAWASHQSETLPDRAALDAALAEQTARFDGAPVPRPPFWSGFRIHPARMEFWQGRPDRLHDRFAFEREGGGWARRRLSP